MVILNLIKQYRVCSVCKELKLDTDFYLRKNTNKLRKECKSCTKKNVTSNYNINKVEINKKRKEYNLDNKFRLKAKRKEQSLNHIERHLKRRYNITVEEKQQMILAQNNRCAICNDIFTGIPNVDHCHSTNKIRGILCWRCNFVLGRVKDNIDVLQNAITYLKTRG